jgi:hypothetical protein
MLPPKTWFRNTLISGLHPILDGFRTPCLDFPPFPFQSTHSTGQVAQFHPSILPILGFLSFSVDPGSGSVTINPPLSVLREQGFGHDQNPGTDKQPMTKMTRRILGMTRYPVCMIGRSPCNHDWIDGPE